MTFPIEHMVAAVEAATLRAHPYPHLHMPGLLPPEQAADLTRWLSQSATWWEQKRDFYIHDSCDNLETCSLSQGGGVLSHEARDALARALSERLGLDLDARHASLCAHRMKAGHGIGVHTDDPSLGTEAVRLLVTLQSSDSYEDRHGGHFCMYQSSDAGSIASIYRPLHNSAIGFAMSERSYHAVNDVTFGERYSVVFGFWDRSRMLRASTPARKRPEHASSSSLAGMRDAERLVGVLRERGANAVGHSGATLLSHLIGVAAILREWECDDEVCRAGLFHSVYGTATFHTRLFSEGERAFVRDTIGVAAERLVWLFSTVRFSEVYRAESGAYLARCRDAAAPVEIELGDIAALNLIALANTFEQAPASPIDPGDAFEWRQAMARLAQHIPPKALAALQSVVGGDS